MNLKRSHKVDKNKQNSIHLHGYGYCSQKNYITILPLSLSIFTAVTENMFCLIVVATVSWLCHD